MRLALVLATTGLLAACSPNVRPCVDGTVFVSVELQGDTASADTLLVDVTVDGVGTASVPVPHEPGQKTGGLLVEFPKGYPTGKTVNVNITARLGSVVLGSGGYGVVITQSCHAVDIKVASPGGPDLASALDLLGADLVGADLTTPPIDDLTGVAQDLTGVTLDLTGVAADLRIVDLTPPPGSDLACVPAGSEDCFNDADDDCDGLIDCADPDCTGGAIPVAECVPQVTGSGTLGTMTPATSCPSAYPTRFELRSGFSAASCTTGTAQCSTGMTDPGGCSHTLGVFTGSTCTENGLVGSFGSPGCYSINTAASGGSFKWNAAVWNSTCSGSGSASKVPASFTQTTSFCSRTGSGRGCLFSQVCVPRASNHCVRIAGSASCPNGYTAQPTQYYGGLDDTVSCSFDCSTGATQGACAPVSAQLLNGCAGPSVSPVVDVCLPATHMTNGYSNVQLIAPTSAGVCGSVKVREFNSSSPKDQQTICCLP